MTQVKTSKRKMKIADASRRRERYTIREVADAFCVTKQTIRNWLRRGYIAKKHYIEIKAPNGKVIRRLFFGSVFKTQNGSAGITERQNDTVKKLLKERLK